MNNISFKFIKLEDRPILNPIVSQIPYQLCNYTFANMIIWSSTYSPVYTIIDGMLVIISQSEGKQYFNFPLGNGDAKQVISKLLQYTKEKEIPFKMINITEEMKVFLEENYPDKFSYLFSPDYSDYLYNMSDLLLLQGKKYQSKRNHINKFKKLYDYQYNSMTQQDIPECMEMHKQWALKHCKDGNTGLENEICATIKALQLFNKLELKGGVLRVDRKVVAFTLGQAINNSTFDVCVEKALSEYEGAYSFINQQFVEHQLSAYHYVNREEDVGEEGLRKAKLSYNPVKLIHKYSIQLKMTN
jgi:hypothetical protein